MNEIIVIGCGWLGKAFAQLAVAKGSRVMGSTTRKDNFPDLSSNHIEPFIYELGNQLPQSVQNLKKPTIFIAVPPSKSKSYDSALAATLTHIKSVFPDVSLYFASSTGYYPKAGSFDETSQVESVRSSSPQVFKAEELVRNHFPNCCLLRFGGLYNLSDRNPANWFKGKKTLCNGIANMVHQQDAAQATLFAIEHSLTGVYNVVPPRKMTKQEFYTAIFNHQNREIPTFSSAETSKWVSGKKLSEEGFSYQYQSQLV